MGCFNSASVYWLISNSYRLIHRTFLAFLLLVSCEGGERTTRMLRLCPLRNIANLSRRIACHNRKRRYVLGNYTSCANRTAFSNPHTRENRDISSQPAVLLNMNLSPEFRSFGAVADLRVERMGSTEQRNIRSQKTSITDGDFTCIKNRTVEIYKDIFAENDVRP